MLELVGTIITWAKILMQGLWKTQLKWDESSRRKIYSDWILFRSDLEKLTVLKIPCINNKHRKSRIAWLFLLKQAYGACIYLYLLIEADKWEAQLLCTKSRVILLKLSFFSSTIRNMMHCYYHN